MGENQVSDLIEAYKDLKRDYKKLIGEFIEDIDKLIVYAEEPHLTKSLSMSYYNYEELIRDLKKKWEQRAKQ